MTRTRGFTLVELLVTISIIAILSTVGMVVYGQVTMNARDAKRKLDLQNIAQALEMYYQKNGEYPRYLGMPDSPDASEWIPGLVPTYINALPEDPKGNGGKPYTPDNLWGYYYWSGDTSDPQYSGCPAPGQWYILATVLENHNDPDRAELKDYKVCDGRSLIQEGWSRYTYVITPNQ